jgi:hypothetical protein
LSKATMNSATAVTEKLQTVLERSDITRTS